MAGSLILFVLFILIYILISDIITIFFRLTGMTEEKARFQVISLLTNSGFTTRESEAVVSSAIRRRLARGTMLFGYAFTVTIVSATVNFFMTLDKSELASLFAVIPLLLGVILVFQMLRRSAFFKTMFDEGIERLGSRIIFREHANPVMLMEDYGDVVVAHVLLRQVPSVLRGVSLAESDLMAKYNIMAMLVKNRKGESCQANADTVLRAGDIIIVMGKRKDIRAVFEKA